MQDSSGAHTVARIGSFLRRIAGMPDYEAYLEHLRSSHPEKPLPTRREYYAEYLSSRYGDGPTRCC
ncbi:MAG TPA: YbdD/YjiX family protein [Gemmatimonadales bacterium]|nr:YbdD/YjiX family protein [Gemmatimonadales bacterium]